MTDKNILEISMKQSAEDIGSKTEDFFSDENIIVPLKLGENAKKYYKLPIGCNFISYGNNIVAGVTDETSEAVKEYINKFEFYHCFETPNLYYFNEKLKELGFGVCFMAEYYLPDLSRLKEYASDYEMQIIEKGNFDDLYLPEWSNALCADRKNLDVLGVGMYEENKLIGLAACSADAEQMWQIGVDVLPEYRQKGIARALTSKLALEILKRDKVPFYCTAWSNLRSVRNAYKCGFIPAWVEMTAKPLSFIDDMNKQSD